MSMCRAVGSWRRSSMPVSAAPSRRRCRLSSMAPGRLSAASRRSIAGVPPLTSPPSGRPLSLPRDGGDVRGGDSLGKDGDSSNTPKPRQNPIRRRAATADHWQGCALSVLITCLPGPYGTTILAELGADVIKVESSKGGMDPFRFFGTGEDPNLSPRFLEFNRNKRSFTVNLKHPKGQGVLHDLVAKADAVLDNYSVDVVERIGLGYRDLCAVKPDIINLRMPGLGTTGPKRHFSTVGVNITSFTGLTYLWNHPGNTNPPIGSQTVFPDYVSGVLCAIIIISGVLHRDRQNKGAFIDLAQAEATAFMIGASLMEAAVSGKDPEPSGNASTWAAPHDCYPCAGEDRWCVIAAENDEQWMALAKILDGGIDQDGRFKTADDRLKHRAELNRIIAAWTREQDAFVVMDRLQKAGIPSGVVQTGEDLTNDPAVERA